MINLQSSRLRAVSVILALAFIFVLSAAAVNPGEQAAGENTVPYYARSEKDSYEYETISELNGISLAVDKNQAAIMVTDTTGKEWHSTPPDYMEDELSNSATKMAMASLILVSYADITGNITTVNGYAASVRKSTYSVREINNGIRFTFTFEREGFVVPVEFWLDGAGLNASVVMGEIRETNQNFKLIQIALLPYFGAAKLGTSGYFLVPDGCGALIEYDKSNIFAEHYQQRVYGGELSTTRLEADGIKRQALLPVFGSKQGEEAFVGIITSGAPRAIISAKAAGIDAGYSRIGITFIYRETDMVFIEKKNQTVRIFETRHSAYDRHTVRYQFQSGQKADYVGMAETYRNYLIDEAGIDLKEEKIPVYINLLGGIRATTNVLGFPVNRIHPLTDFAAAADFLQSLISDGVSPVGLQYTNWQKGGDRHPVQTSIKPEGKLGGKSGFKKLLDYCGQNGVKLYPDINLTDIRKTSFRYGTGSAAKSIQKQPAMQYHYRLNNNSAILSEATFLLSPNRFYGLSDMLIKSIRKWDMTSIGLTTLGQKLYSDFGGNHVSRDKAEDIWNEVLSKFKQQPQMEILLSSAAGYALKYADVITDTPSSSSGFDCTTEDVPFYQIALKGLIPLSVETLNHLPDYRKGLLFAAETGAALQYEIFNENEQLLKDSHYYSHIINGLMSEWINKIADGFREIAPLYQAVSGATISGHRRIQPGVAKTVYSNGVVVIVNYNNFDIVHEGTTVKALGFHWEG